MKHGRLLMVLVLMPLVAIGALAAEEAAEAPEAAAKEAVEAEAPAAEVAEPTEAVTEDVAESDDLDAFDEEEDLSEDEDAYAQYEEDEPIELNLVINAIPAALLINAGDTFAVSTEDGGTIDLETVYMMPNLNVGIGAEIEDLYVDLTVGAGIVVSETFRSFLLQASLALWYEAADSFSIGPHIGVIWFPNPKWLDNTYDVEFDDTWGLMLGIQLAMGDKVQYYVSVDLISAAFDASNGDDEVELDLEDGEFELTGLAVQFGVRGIF